MLLAIPFVFLISLFKTNSSQAIYKVEYDRFWTYKVHSKKKFDMIILGDSRVYRGISPQAINKILPKIKIDNFGFSSGILNNEIFMEADKRIDQLAKLKIILIGISPGSLTEYENTHFRDIRKQPNSEVFDKLYMNYFISKFLSPVKPSEVFMIKKQSEPETIKEVFYNNGWVASTTNDSNHSKYISSYQKYWAENKVSKSRIDDLKARIATWTKDGVFVFAFRAPSSLEIDTIENRVSGFDENDLSEKIKSDGGHWIPLIDKYNRYLSYDGCHLKAKSAMLLSEDIALEIKRVLKIDEP